MNFERMKRAIAVLRRQRLEWEDCCALDMGQPGSFGADPSAYDEPDSGLEATPAGWWAVLMPEAAAIARPERIERIGTGWFLSQSEEFLAQKLFGISEADAELLLCSDVDRHYDPVGEGGRYDVFDVIESRMKRLARGWASTRGVSFDSVWGS